MSPIDGCRGKRRRAAGWKREGVGLKAVLQNEDAPLKCYYCSSIDIPQTIDGIQPISFAPQSRFSQKITPILGSVITHL